MIGCLQHVSSCIYIVLKNKLFVFMLALISRASNSGLKLLPSLQLEEVSDPVKPMQIMNATLSGIVNFQLPTHLGTLP
jgi:hypothetical protein